MEITTYNNHISSYDKSHSNVKLTLHQPPKHVNLGHSAFQTMPWLDLELVDELQSFESL